jgi:hypothetical protein
MPTPTHEWVGNYGYAAFITETTPGAAITPTVFAVLDNETLSTSYNLEDQTAAFGIPEETFQVLPGLRDHKGDFEIIAEPNTAAHLFDMLLLRGSVSGSDPYTWPFTLSGTTVPKSKTVDISTGNIVKRFVGVQASKVTGAFSKNQLNLKASVSALGSFQGGVLASAPTTAGTSTIVFDTTYDTSPTSKLVIGDLVRGYHAGSVYIDGTIATIVDSKTITATTSASPDYTSLVAGDMIYLRPQTVSFTIKNPFLWSNTEFRFAGTASTALSAAQTRLEQGSMWELDYGFESDSGSQRSGNADPASLVRMLGHANLTSKVYFDKPDDVINFNQLNKTACVIRHFAYQGGKTYELRVTVNHLVTDDPLPKVKAKAVNYSNIKYKSQFDQSDGQSFSVAMLNGLPSLA